MVGSSAVTQASVYIGAILLWLMLPLGAPLRVSLWRGYPEFRLMSRLQGSRWVVVGHSEVTEKSQVCGARIRTDVLPGSPGRGAVTQTTQPLPQPSPRIEMYHLADMKLPLSCSRCFRDEGKQ